MTRSGHAGAGRAASPTRWQARAAAASRQWAAGPGDLGTPHSALLAVRLALASPFAASAIAKAADWPSTVAEFSSLGLWFPEASAAATIIVQFLGSLLLLTRRWTWAGAGLLAAFTVLATIVAHPFWAFPQGERIRQLMTFLEHVALTGGLIASAMLASAASGQIALQRLPRPGLADPPAI